MKLIHYSCDICGDAVGKRLNGERPFVGYELGLMGDHCRSSDRFFAKAPSEADRHICSHCLAGLVALARRTLPAETVKDALGAES